MAMAEKQMQALVATWFQLWEQGDFTRLPISDAFSHTSPFGVIKGKGVYLDWVAANKDKFLGYRFEIHDALYANDRAALRYTAVQRDFRLEVSEWHYACLSEVPARIGSIYAYYHIGDIGAERQLARRAG